MSLSVKQRKGNKFGGRGLFSVHIADLKKGDLYKFHNIEILTLEQHFVKLKAHVAKE